MLTILALKLLAGTGWVLMKHYERHSRRPAGSWMPSKFHATRLFRATSPIRQLFGVDGNAT